MTPDVLRNNNNFTTFKNGTLINGYIYTHRATKIGLFFQYRYYHKNDVKVYQQLIASPYGKCW